MCFFIGLLGFYVVVIVNLPEINYKNVDNSFKSLYKTVWKKPLFFKGRL